MAINKNKVLANAQRYSEKGAYDKAIAEYLKVVKEEPEDVRAWLKIGDLYAKKGSIKEATATYLKVAEFYGSQGFYLKAVAVYKQILKLDPTVIQVNLRLAELYQQLGLLSDAQSQYEHVSAYFQRAGQVREALDVMQKLVDLDPDNVPSRIKLAELYSKADLRDDAVREFGVAAERLREQGRIDDFIKVAERMLWHKSDELDLARELATIYLERNDAKRALAKLQQCFQVNPHDVETLALLATAFQTIGQIAKTISVYKEMARIFEEQGDEIRRREVLEAVLAIAPDDAEAAAALYGEQPPKAADYNAPGMPPQQPVAPGYGDYDPAVMSVDSADIEMAPSYPDQSYSEPVYGEQINQYGQQSYEPYQDAGQAATSYDGQADAFPEIEEIEEVEEIEEIEELEEIQDVGSGESYEEFQDVIVVENQSVEDEIRRLMTETDVFVKYGLYDKAIEHLQKIFELEPLNIDARERLKDLYVQLGDIDRAVLELLYLADLYFESDADGALYYLQQITQLVPDHPDALERMRRLGVNVAPSGYDVEHPNVQQQAGPYTEASDLMFSIDEDLVEEYDPNQGVASSDVALAQGEDDIGFVQPPEESTLETPDVTNDYVAPQPSANAGPQPSVNVAALEEELEEVEFFAQQGLVDEARNMLLELSQTYPNNKLVLEKLAEVGSLTPADDVEGTIDLGTPSEDELQALGLADGVGEGEAKDVFEQFKEGVAQQVDAGDADTHFDLGVAYKEMGLVEDAVAEFEIARENPAREAIAQTMIGHCYVQAGQHTEAISAYKRGLYAEQKAPQEELELYYALGTTYVALSDPKEALYYFQKVAKREPDFRDVQQRIQGLSS